MMENSNSNESNIESRSSAYSASEDSDKLANANIALALKVKDLEEKVKKLENVDKKTAVSIKADPTIIVSNPSLRVADDFQPEPSFAPDSDLLDSSNVTVSRDKTKRMYSAPKSSINPDKQDLFKYYYNVPEISSDTLDDDQFEENFPNWSKQEMFSKTFRKLTILKNLASCAQGPEPDLKFKEEFDLTDVDHIPKIWRNPGVLTGYRIFFSVPLCVKSLFKLHNETGNIWSHIIGFCIFIYFSIMSLELLLMQEVTADAFLYGILLFYVLCGVFCMLSSVIYHTFYCHSFHWHNYTWRIDISGITVLVGAHYLPTLYLAYYCQPVVYSAGIAIGACLSIMSIILIFSDVVKAKMAENVYKALMLTSTSILIIMVIASLFFERNPDTLLYFLLPSFISFVIFTVGFFIYMFRFPECIYPGKFDLFFNSHQLWHLIVLCAAVFFTLSMKKYIKMRTTMSCE